MRETDVLKRRRAAYELLRCLLDEDVDRQMRGHLLSASEQDMYVRARFEIETGVDMIERRLRYAEEKLELEEYRKEKENAK